MINDDTLSLWVSIFPTTEDSTRRPKSVLAVIEQLYLEVYKPVVHVVEPKKYVEPWVCLMGFYGILWDFIGFYGVL